MRVQEHGGMTPVRCWCGVRFQGVRGAGTVLSSAEWLARFLRKALFCVGMVGRCDYVLMGKFTRMLIKAVCCVTGRNAEDLILRRG